MNYVPNLKRADKIKEEISKYIKKCDSPEILEPYLQKMKKDVSLKLINKDTSEVVGWILNKAIKDGRVVIELRDKKEFAEGYNVTNQMEIYGIKDGAMAIARIMFMAGMDINDLTKRQGHLTRENVKGLVKKLNDFVFNVTPVKDYLHPEEAVRRGELEMLKDNKILIFYQLEVIKK